MFVFLDEIASSFESTSVEYSGDLGQYRMAIEDDMRDREVPDFAMVRALTRARIRVALYHHLPVILLSSSCHCIQKLRPFENDGSSIMTLFSPLLSVTMQTRERNSTAREQMKDLFID